MRSRLLLTSTVVAVGLIAGVNGCRWGSEPDPLRPYAILAQAIDTLLVGGTGTLSFAVINEDGDTLDGVPLTVKATDTTVVSIVNDSTFTAKKVGSTTVTLTALDSVNLPVPGVQADVLFQVLAIAAHTMTLSRTTDTLTVGDSVTLTATIKDSSGATVTGHTVTWLSGNKAVATVTTGGKVKAVAPGFAHITAATDGGVSTSASITVVPKG